MDFTQLKSTLTSEIQRVQGALTRAQAEEYVHRSEALLREAGEFLKDAVKVVPPEDREDGVFYPDVVLDGSQVVVMPPTVGSFGPGNRDFLYSGPGGSGTVKGKGKGVAASARARAAGLVGTRAAAMLAQLRQDPEELKRDPSLEEGTKDAYDAWVKEHITSQAGGLESEVWTKRIKDALADGEDGKTLGATKDTLGTSIHYLFTHFVLTLSIIICSVPSVIDSNTFWMRYFFKARQIEKDEEKRKALLAGMLCN